MIRAGDIERDCLLDSLSLGDLECLGDFLLLARDDDLAGSVQVSEIHIRFTTDLPHLCFLCADDRRHGAAGGVASLLHEQPASPHDPQPFLKWDAVGGGMGSEFSETQAGGCGKIET